MADGDRLILRTNNNIPPQTNLGVGLGEESGSYGLQLQQHRRQSKELMQRVVELGKRTPRRPKR